MSCHAQDRQTFPHPLFLLNLCRQATSGGRGHALAKLDNLSVLCASPYNCASVLRRSIGTGRGLALTTVDLCVLAPGIILQVQLGVLFQNGVCCLTVTQPVP
jgi:hypothetical protein